MRMTFSILDITCKGINLKLTMREFALTQKLLNSALETAYPKRIKRVNLLIGSFSEEREDSIQFYWKDLAKGSPGDGAKLHFDHVKAEMRCLDCSGMSYIDQNETTCTCKYCYSDHLQLLVGEDVQIESIEVE
jgi:hydrogenase nickel incorporation protein HypA/HybF